MRNEAATLERPASGAALRAAALPDTLPHARKLPLDDPEALGRLLLALEPRLLAVATRITRHPEAARDVVQDAFEKVLRHGDRFQGQSRVSTWLHRIVTNEALMWLRSARRRGEVSGDDAIGIQQLTDPGSSPAEQAQGRQTARHLHAVLDQLCDEERDVIVRCGLREESYATYSKRSGLHPGAVKTRAFRGRRRLQALLASS